MNTSKSFMTPGMGRVKSVHFVGIGGAGMSGIAEVLHAEGYQVSGSDLNENVTVTRLKKLGIPVFIGHHQENITGADVLVRSTAISADNPELLAAKAQSIPVIPRAVMLAELMRYRQGIAVAGTHGKTTTTSLVTTLLTEGGLDPSYVIGGKLTSSGSHAHLGSSSFFVAEADESDASFLFLKPTMAIVTNIDADHMETYEGSFDKLKATFLQFLHQLPFYGPAVLCIEDPQIREMLPQIERPILSYGFAEDAAYRAIHWQQSGLSSQFEVLRPSPHKNLKISFQWPGRHNVLNALAAIAIATEVGVSDEGIIQGLARFQGVGRRFQMLGQRCFEKGQAMVIDDYGHHPQEIRATIEACKKVWPDRRLIHVFQPHRYTRTQALYEQLVDALSLSDTLLLMDIYSAGEQAIEGVSSEHLAEALKDSAVKVLRVNAHNLEEKLNLIVDDSDIILMQGAGSIGQLALDLMDRETEEPA